MTSEELLEKIDVEFDAWDRAEHFELFELIEHALEQARKQEKLLELMDKYNKSNLREITLDEAKEFWEELENETKKNIKGNI